MNRPQKDIQKAPQQSCNIAETPRPLEQLSDKEVERKERISRVMTYTLAHLSSRFVDNGFEWLLPVIFSRSTDPLWPDPGASIDKCVEVEIYGKTVRATSSMIVHKIVASSLVHPKLFMLSPNIRIEKSERAKSGMHAYEFTQLDFEVRTATSEEIRSFVEDIICELINSLKNDLREELEELGRYSSLKVPKTFKVYDKRELEIKYGKKWESQIMVENHDPIWITNIPREFYDFEEVEKGIWDNYDLFLPEYGEVLSGSKREWEYNKLMRKMERDNICKKNYQLLLRLGREGRLKPSAGAGIGIERLVSWLVGANHIGETQPFPKIPGTIYDL